MPARKPEERDMLLMEAMNTGDLDTAVAQYEPKATYVLDSGEVIMGQAAIREAAQGFWRLSPSSPLRSRRSLVAMETSR